MTNTDDNSRVDKSRTRQRKEGEQQDNDKAPGKHSESGYPDDDYWDQGVRDKAKSQPAEPAEPDTGYRWEPSEDSASSEDDSEKKK